MIWQTTREQLDLLARCEKTRVSRALLERLNVGVDGAVEGKSFQIGKMVGTQSWTKPLLAQGFEGRPRNVVNAAGIPLQHVVPLLSDVHEVEGSKPDLRVLSGLLTPKEVLTFVQPTERVRSAIERRERELVEARDLQIIMGIIPKREMRSAIQVWNG